MAQTRDNTFDIMKGIGILLVLLGHVWELQYIDKIIYSFHMPLFFLIAGYFSHSYKDYALSDISNVILKYARRLVVPFVITTIFTVGMFMVLAVAKHNWNDVITQLLSLLWGDICLLETPWGGVCVGVVWFLLALFWAKTFLLLLSRWERWVLPISFLLSIGALLLHSVFPYSIWCISIGLVALPFVALGWWLRHHHVPYWVYAICIICLIIANIYSSLDMYDYIFDCYPLDVIGACGGTLCVYFLSRLINRCGESMRWIPNTFEYLGQISLTVVCVHSFEISTHLGSHIVALTPWAPLPLWALYIVRYALTILLAIAVVHTPYLKKVFA